MKRICIARIALPSTLLLLIVLAFTADSFWNEITVKEGNAREIIFGNIKYGYLDVPEIAQKVTVKSLASDRRIAIVQAMGNYIKKYIHSTEFKDKYLENPPTEPSKPVKPDTSSNANNIANQSLSNADDQTAQMEAMINNPALPEDARAQLKKALDDLKKSGVNTTEIAEKDKKEREAAIKTDKENAMKQYNADMVLYKNDKRKYDSLMTVYKTMEVDFKPNEIMKGRLNEFLKFTETIDFNAKLVDKGDKFFVFEKPEYENKSNDWKKCFRAGKVTIDAARNYAKNWLREIESNK
jgi:hypothetical protein